MLYRKKRGPLNPLLRMDAGFALLAAAVFNAQRMNRQDGQPFRPADFMPWAKDEPEEATPEAALLLLKSLAKRKH